MKGSAPGTGSPVRTYLWGWRIRRIVSRIIKGKLSYLDREALTDLAGAIRRLRSLRVPGIFVEAGCALGGSAIVIATAKEARRPLFLYDSFGLIPPPSRDDGRDAHERFAVIEAGKAEGIGGQTYYGYRKGLRQEVEKNLQRNGLNLKRDNIFLVSGFFEETMNIQEPVAFAHIDCDWYHSVLTCLERIVPRLAVGGIIVIDDYGTWSGCTEAVDRYFASQRDAFAYDRRSRLHITRK